MAADRYAYAASGRLRRLMRDGVALRPVAWLTARVLPAIDRRVFALTRGRVELTAWVTGLPVVRLTTTGARSGAPRTARVLGIPVEDGFVVVAANFGATRHPAWYLNLRAHPRATVTAGGATCACEARELRGAERDAAFALSASLNPAVRRFRRHARGRPIPVLRLRRV